MAFKRSLFSPKFWAALLSTAVLATSARADNGFIQQPKLRASLPQQADVANPLQVPSSHARVEAGDVGQLASLISHQINEQAVSNETPHSVGAIDDPPGWQSVGERLSRHIQECESLLKHNAFLSARDEAEQAVLHLVRHLDLLNNNCRCEPAWLAAQQTLKEADDFALARRLSSDRGLLRIFIDSHETSVLKKADVQDLSPLVASQHYRQHAQKSLLMASESHPWASEAFYAIGRTYQAQAEAGDKDADTLKWRAATYYRAAQLIDPNNSIAGNQLGFMMLHMDRPVDAMEALNAAINVAPSQANLQNLVEASRRLGDTVTRDWALQNLAILQSRMPQTAGTPQFTEVDARTFAAMSPYTAGPTYPARQPNRTTGQRASMQY